MYGSSSKLGRGGPAIARSGGAGPKRFPAPQPPTRPTAPSRPLSAGGARNRMNSGPGSSAPPAVEETFNLVSGNNSHVFGMIIRLTPDLIEEIKRLEAQGETARIKFDSNANNTAGNVIDVGGKAYRFTWSREFGDLCDIYEERQSGEEGNGLLVESGCAWRKLNVQRVLDESTKNHVKMRSEEAERKHKSRKAIVLEHGNASMKSQVKQLVAAEVNPRRMFFKKKELPNKKQKVEPRHVSSGEFSRSAHKMGFSSTFKTNVKGGRSSSPLSLSPAQRNASISPSGADNVMRSSMPLEEAVHTPLMGKENAASSDKDMMNKATVSVKERAGSKVNLGAKPTDLQSMLINLLTANPKGMSLKALEKAIGDTFPNSGKKIEPILKKIATYQAPGRYLLKSEADFESFKRYSSASGSSPEDNNNHIPVPEEDRNQTSFPEPAFAQKAPSDEGFAPLNTAAGEEMNASEDVDIEHHSPNIFDKTSENSEGRAGSSSDSGSDSDSDSGSSDSRSESGSPNESRSRSRSRSPNRSGSTSSSDSESDASSNSKEGSDQDVDIISDDEKEPMHKFHASGRVFSTPPEGRPAPDGTYNKQDSHDSDFVDIENDFTNDEEPDDHANEGTGLISKKEHSKSPEESFPVSFKHDDFIERQNFIGSLFDEKETNFSDNFKSEHSDSHKVRKDKSRREYDPKPAMNPERVKRLKAESLSQQPVAGISIGQNPLSPCELSPSRIVEDSFKSSSHQTMNKADRDSDAELGSQKGWKQAYPGKSSLNSHQYSSKSLDQGIRATAHDAAGRPNKSESLGNDTRLPSKNFNTHESLDTQKEKSGKETFSEGHVSDKSSRSMKEGGSARKQYAPPDPHHQKIDETCFRGKEFEHTNSHVESSPKGNNRAGTHISSLVNGRGAVLQRELSDLELGELREPVADEASTKKQFERKSSFKMSENKPNKSNSCNVDVARGKPPDKESGKPSSPILGTRTSGSMESISRKRTLENRGDDFTVPVPPGVQSELPFSLNNDHGDSGWQTNSVVDVNKSKKNEAGTRRGVNPEESRKSQKGASIDGTQHVDNKRGQASQAVKEGKLQASNVALSTASGQKDAVSADNSSYKRRESSSDENSPYSKYEKNEPELKGRIKDFSQYEEYVQEYRDKYDSYCSLNKTLEKYGDEFQKLGKDLDSAKGRDVERYNNLLQELKESYSQCGPRHKRLKKIFVVLHEELKNLKQMIKDYALAYSRD